MKRRAAENEALGYRKYQAGNRWLVVGLLAAWLLLGFLALTAGSYQVPLPELLKAIFGKAEQANINTVIHNLRLPRVLTAMFGGAGLGLVGCVLQAILRNPLASASTLGISQGASFGAAFAIIVLGAGVQGSAVAAVKLINPVLISFCAFIGSIAVSILILGLSRVRKITAEGMILAGVALSAMLGGATILLQFFADEVQLASVVFWSFGDLGRTGWREVGIIALVTGAVALYFLFNRWEYNAMEAGEQTAVSLGVNVAGRRIANMLLCSVAAAVIVSYVGIINFIGLVAPHIVRRLIGNNHVFLLPGSAFMGGILLLLADLVARMTIAPVILPIGAITSFMGGPLFLYLLFKKNA